MKKQAIRSALGRMAHAPALLAAPFLAFVWLGPAASEEGIEIPPAATDQAASSGMQTAVLAGGCFWGVEAVFQHVKGVENAVSGYSGGTRETARYEIIGSGRTGHAEAVEITYDPEQITYGKLLQVYFSVAHDPTEVNRQGPDVGPQYRSAIFAANEEQRNVAEAYIAQLDDTGVYSEPIATTTNDLAAFYAAEDYHQDFMARNPNHPYIVMHDAPKIANLQRLFPDLYRESPVEAKAARS